MATKEEKKGSSNAWQWFLGGVVVGILLSGFVYAKWLMKPNIEQAEPQNVSQNLEKDSKSIETKVEEKKPEPEKKLLEKTAEKTTGIQFEFYEKLPKNQAIRTPAPPPTNKTESKAEETPKHPVGSLMLQVASTVDKKAGEEMLADLKELGFQGELQEATINGKTWFRIRVGPYLIGQIPEAQKKLKENGFEGIIVKP
jgi:cell division protein FtsN